MIGLLRIHPVSGPAININPNHISLFCTSTSDMVKMISSNAAFARNSTIVVINGMMFQVKETERDIVNALTRLRKKQEGFVKKFKEDLDREDWRGDYDEEDED